MDRDSGFCCMSTARMGRRRADCCPVCPTSSFAAFQVSAWSAIRSYPAENGSAGSHWSSCGGRTREKRTSSLSGEGFFVRGSGSKRAGGVDRRTVGVGCAFLMRDAMPVLAVDAFDKGPKPERIDVLLPGHVQFRTFQHVIQ